jgi:hypothetical protein
LVQEEIVNAFTGQECVAGRSDFQRPPTAQADEAEGAGCAIDSIPGRERGIGRVNLSSVERSFAEKLTEPDLGGRVPGGSDEAVVKE